MNKEMPKIIPEVCPLINSEDNCLELETFVNEKTQEESCLAYFETHGLTDPKDYIKCWVFSRWFWRKVIEGRTLT